jgi:hypothetical protein
MQQLIHSLLCPLQEGIGEDVYGKVRMQPSRSKHFSHRLRRLTLARMVAIRR